MALSLASVSLGYAPTMAPMPSATRAVSPLMQVCTKVASAPTADARAGASYRRRIAA